jgi:hypothetical protein
MAGARSMRVAACRSWYCAIPLFSIENPVLLRVVPRNPQLACALLLENPNVRATHINFLFLERAQRPKKEEGRHFQKGEGSLRRKRWWKA